LACFFLYHGSGNWIVTVCRNADGKFFQKYIQRVCRVVEFIMQVG
jgi:hypothetical protein